MDQLTHNAKHANWLNILNQCQERPANITVRKSSIVGTTTKQNPAFLQCWS